MSRCHSLNEQKLRGLANDDRRGAVAAVSLLVVLPSFMSFTHSPSYVFPFGKTSERKISWFELKFLKLLRWKCTTYVGMAQHVYPHLRLPGSFMVFHSLWTFVEPYSIGHSHIYSTCLGRRGRVVLSKVRTWHRSPCHAFCHLANLPRRRHHPHIGTSERSGQPWTSIVTRRLTDPPSPRVRGGVR